MDAQSPASAWDRFWQYDRLSSFESGPGAANYGANVADGWATFFRALPDAPAILDLCTGNGAIAVLAAETRPDAKVTGVDYAAIDPTQFCTTAGGALERIRFQGRVMAEDLPMADASLDAVASQFGIEYSDMDRSLGEVMRVLRHGGRLRLAMHAAEGAVVRDTARSIRDADFLLDDKGLIASAMRSYGTLTRYERGERDLAATAQRDYGAFRNALVDADAHERSAMDTAMLRSVRADIITLFNQRKQADPAEATLRLERLKGEIEDHRERQRALTRAARSRADVEQFASRLIDAGFGEVAITAQFNEGETIAHVLDATKTGDGA